MAISSKHPDYVDLLPDWEKVYDFYKGSRRVKDKGVVYLPLTPGMQKMLSQAGEGASALTLPSYKDYRFHSKFANLFKSAVNGAHGVATQKPAVVKDLPDEMKYLEKDATVDGRGLQDLVEDVLRYIFRDGRVLLLADVGSDGLIRYATYPATSIINWFGDTVVLQETVEEVNDFQVKDEAYFRVLRLVVDEIGRPVFAGGVFREGESFDENRMIIPRLFNGDPSFETQYTFINANDTTVSAEVPPLMPLVDLDQSIYNMEAARRYAARRQSDDLLVINKSLKDGDEELNIDLGASRALILDKEEKAGYIVPSGKGVEVLGQIIQEDKKDASLFIANLFFNDSRQRQSAEAMNIQANERATMIHPMVLTAEQGINQAFRRQARWMSLNDEEVDISLNKSYSAVEVQPDKMAKIIELCLGPNSKVLVEDAIAYYLSMDFSDKTVEEIMEGLEAQNERRQQETPPIPPPNEQPEEQPEENNPVNNG